MWFLQQVLKIFTLLHFLQLSNIFMSVGWDVKWCPVSRITTPWHAKDRFTGFRWRVGSWGPPGKLQNFKTDHSLLIVAAVIWLKYCRYGVKHYPNKPIRWTMSLISLLFTTVIIKVCWVFISVIFILKSYITFFCVSPQASLPRRQKKPLSPAPFLPRHQVA